MKTRIIIIDDHQLFREGVKQILSADDKIEVVAEGEDGDQALELVQQYQPDVVIMDINMPNVCGIEATKQIVDKYPDLNVVILSLHDDEKFVTQSLQAGANSYLLKEMDTDSLLSAIKVICAGNSYLHPKVACKLLKDYRTKVKNGQIPSSPAISQQGVRRPLHILTRRECEVLQLLADGKSNKGVGDSLYISEKTVKNHVSNILQKMSVNDRTQAVVTAIKNGWVAVN